MNKTICSMVLTIVLSLAGCSDSGNTNGSQEVQVTPESGSGLEATKMQDVKEEVWSQLSKERKEEIVGSWETGKVSKVKIETYRFQGAESYMGKELLMISFPSTRGASLGDVSVFVEPQTRKIAGYGLRD